ncbi:hypothetical protein NDU88_003873 [Pleurodeles waltl]|uniref:Uncharacterized protein n=1 Tax=Pleurodeles waltl TaxID=8319 RepID=A0AAV7M4N4_PLEWA|nr:hypothetical protein NDU88_003873 [Pleurodeles waltl]
MNAWRLAGLATVFVFVVASGAPHYPANGGHGVGQSQAGLTEDMKRELMNGGFRSSQESKSEHRPKALPTAVAVLPGLHSPINTEVNGEQELMVNDHTENLRQKREVTGGSPPTRRRTRPPQPDCTGCYSSLNLQSDPGSNSDPEGSE